MTNYESGSRAADKFVVRMPEGLRSQVESEADASDRSMNAVAVRALREYLDGRQRKKALLDALEQATAWVDKVRVNQISETDENVNQQQNAPQNIPGIIPAGWTDAQVLQFCSVALRHVVVQGDLKFSDINDGLRYMADLGQPAFVRAFDIDEHVKLVKDAERYRWLRDRTCIEDADNDLMVVRGDAYFDGAELDREIDNGMRLDRLMEKHGETEPCAD